MNAHASATGAPATAAGQIDDLLVGRTCPTHDRTRGRGVRMVDQLCGLVQTRSSAAGTVVRVHGRPVGPRVR